MSPLEWLIAAGTAAALSVTVLAMTWTVASVVHQLQPKPSRYYYPLHSRRGDAQVTKPQTASIMEGVFA